MYSMKLFHLADLHLGKRLGELSLIPDQQYILEQIVHLVRLYNPRVVLIAGDVYDKAAPSAEAVALFDHFLSELESLGVVVFVIAGNHDSGTRLSFGRQIFEKRGVFIAGHFTGIMEPIEIDGVNFWLLPYLRPGESRRYLEREDIETHEQAVRAVLAEAKVATDKINIILTHQFVTGQGTVPMAQCSGDLLLSQSEVSPVGGMDNVSYTLYDAFDYVACGHLHIPQRVGRDTVRYAGSPLKYSFSEAYYSKSITIVDIEGKDDIKISTGGLTPVRDMRILTGPLKEIVEHAEPTDDYVKVVLTDQLNELPPDPIGILRTVYPNLLNLSFKGSGGEEEVWEPVSPEGRDPLELFGEFYRKQTGCELTEKQTKLVKEVLAHETY